MYYSAVQLNNPLTDCCKYLLQGSQPRAVLFQFAANTLHYQPAFKKAALMKPRMRFWKIKKEARLNDEHNTNLHTTDKLSHGLTKEERQAGVVCY